MTLSFAGGLGVLLLIFAWATDWNIALLVMAFIMFVMMPFEWKAILEAEDRERKKPVCATCGQKVDSDKG